MQKLTLDRRASGLHAVVDPDGKTLGMVNLDDLELDDGEFENMVRRHAEKKRATSAADELIQQVRDYAAKSGKAFSEALCDVSRENMQLAERYRAEVLGEGA